MRKTLQLRRGGWRAMEEIGLAVAVAKVVPMMFESTGLNQWSLLVQYTQEADIEILRRHLDWQDIEVI